MRHTATVLALAAVLGLGLPVIAQTATEQTKGQPIQQTQTGQQIQSNQMSVETHLKAAGYDVIQARQMMQGKNAQMAREALMSARQHIQMAENEAPSTLTSDIRRIATSIDQASTVARTDVNKARQQVAKADQALQKLIKQQEVHGGAMNQPSTQQ